MRGDGQGDERARQIDALQQEVGRLRERDEATMRRVSALLEVVNRSTGVLAGLATRLEAVAKGKAPKEDLQADAVIVRAMRAELCRNGDAFLTDTQDLGPARRVTGAWRPPTGLPLSKRGPRGRGE